MIIFKDREYKCAVELTINLIGGKYKALLLWELSESTKRFNELRKRFPEVTQKMLTQQLRDLENDGLILRHVYPQVPPKVEYSLTDFGKSLMPVIHSMNQWGNNYIKNNTNIVL
jgi:DNA-binding HxlR family transcriptional regulator